MFNRKIPALSPYKVNNKRSSVSAANKKLVAKKRRVASSDSESESEGDELDYKEGSFYHTILFITYF